jgi:hypothetical protein
VYFVASCVLRKLRYHTIKQYLAGIRHHYIAHGVYTPLCSPSTLTRLHLVLRGVHKSQVNRVKTRLPITFPILRDLIGELVRGVIGVYDGLMLAAASSLAFFGFLRCGEFTIKSVSASREIVHPYLSLADVKFSENLESFTLILPASKTDVFHQGISILIYQVPGTTCPVKLISQLVALRRSAGASNSDPLFLTSKGRILCRNFYIASIKSVLQRLGLDPGAYNGHSVRIGAATSAAKAKVPDHLIQTLGRWSSNCYMRYIRTDGQTIRDAQRSMCVS